MTRIILTVVLAFGLAAPAWADVTIRQITGGKGLGMSGNAPATTYIKGSKMRTDVTIDNRTQTTIFDVEAQKMYVFDSRRKEADVWDMAAFAQELSQSVDTSSAKASIKPNGQTKQIGGQTASGYDMEISVNAAMGGNKDMTMMVTLAGPAWIVKGAPGTSDYIAFYNAAVEKGFIFSDPRAAKGQPGQAKAMAQMYKELADIGGMPYETEMQIKMGGSGAGPLGGIMARLGNITVMNRVESVSVEPLADDLFLPPSGYKLNQRQ
jgi:hypothetical protein